MTKERLSREAIAMRIAKEFFDGASSQPRYRHSYSCVPVLFPKECRSPTIPKTGLWDLAE